MDQKTGNELGRLTFLLSILLEKTNMETIQSHPFALQKSGPESKILMSLSLRILKKFNENELNGQSDKDVVSLNDLSEGNLSRSSSVKLSQSLDHLASLKKQDSRVSTSSGIGEQLSIQEEPFVMSTVNPSLSAIPPPSSPSLSTHSGLIHRTNSTSSAGQYNLGRIQLTLRYSIQRQRLVVIVHKISNIPLKDPANIPDPYVKIYLLPGNLPLIHLQN
jgi:hypothetical protein